MSRINSCSKCGATLVYDSAKDVLICHKCGSTTDFDKSGDCARHKFDMDVEISEPEFKQEVYSMHCDNCGAVFQAAGKNISNKCQYCNTNLVMDFALSKGSEPDGCVVYSFDKETAREKFAAEIKKKIFVPNRIKKELPKGNIERVYIPAYVFNIKTQNTYSGRIYDKYKDFNGDSQRRYRKISGVETIDNNDIVVECSENINQVTLEDIKPFDVQRARKFRSEYLLGYAVENYDKKLNDCKASIDDLVKYNAKKIILRNYHYDGVDYFNMSTDYLDCYYSRVLLPTYKIKYKYKGKEYSSFLNGQTGKIGGKLPKSAWKVFGIVAGALIGIGLLIYMFMR